MQFDRNTPLKVEIHEGELIIRIGLNTLAYAAEHNPQFYDDDKHQRTDKYENIVDIEELANDVKRELCREEEDDSSPLSDLLDQAIYDAREDGSLAFEDNEDE